MSPDPSKPLRTPLSDNPHLKLAPKMIDLARTMADDQECAVTILRTAIHAMEQLIHAIEKRPPMAG